MFKFLRRMIKSVSRRHNEMGDSYDEIDKKFDTLKARIKELEAENQRLRLDHLTKEAAVFNRAGFERAFMTLVEKDIREERRREATEIGVLNIDLDRFKSINDTFGHMVGDLVIQAAAKAIQSVLRIHDIAARFGGDEFVVAAPVIGTEGLDRLKERVQNALRLAVINHDGVEVSVEASVGAAMFQIKDTPAPIEAFEEALRRADQEMYKAKKS